MSERNFRHELKYIISSAEMEMIKQRIGHLISLDSHVGENGIYNIRSLYFDDYYDRCLRENEDGTAVSESTTYGFAYAKFVNKDVLSVKAQLREGTTAESQTTDMRLVTTVDNLSYQEVGFDVSTRYGSLSHKINTVYKSIKASEGGVAITYKPTEFYELSTHFATFTITGFFVQGNLDEEIIVEPYWVTADGTIVYGVTRVLTLREGGIGE